MRESEKARAKARKLDAVCARILAARPGKQTSDRVSRIAARFLAKHRKLTAANKLGANSPVIGTDGVRWGDLATLAASCLGQDETKGKRRKVRK